MRPPAHSAASPTQARAMVAKPAGVTSMPPSGSRWSQSKPAETSTNPGANWRTTGATISSNARAYSASPKPAGNGRLSVRPAPAPRPTSSAAPVMKVPVDDRHALDALRLEPGGRERHVVEEAEAHGALALGVVPGWAHQREAVLHLPRQYRLAYDEQAPGGEPRGLPGLGRGRGVRVEDDTRAAGARRHALDVRRGMNERELLLGRGPRAQMDQVARVAEMIEQHAQAIGALRMPAPGIVRQHAPVDDHRRAARHWYAR